MRSLNCTICNKDFATNHSRQLACSKECIKTLRLQQVKQWREENPDSLKGGNLRKKYWPQLSNEEALAEYYSLIELQNNRCAICKKLETSKNNRGKPKKLSVDHCHQTKKVRGLLCSRCNTAVGLLKDNVEIAKDLIVYLVK